MKRFFLALLLALSVGCLSAQSLVCDSGIKHWEGEFAAGLNTDGYQFDFGIAYFPVRFIGLKAQLGMAGEIAAISDWNWGWDDGWNDGWDVYDTDHDYTARFKFTMSLVLRSPMLINWKSQDAGIYLFAEPGIVLSPGAAGSRRAKWACWNGRIGLNLQYDRFVIGLGYGISDFSLYSGYPDSHWGAPVSPDYITHSGFLVCAYKF